MEKSSFAPIGEGILRSSILTVALMVIYAIIMSFTDLSDKFNSIFYIIVSILSIMYGTIYAVKKIEKRGWLVGIIVATIYMIIIYMLSLIAGNTPGIYYVRIIRFLMAILVGILSGMIGVNI
ncbi:TIGR04086 family membrane protein [Clostridium tetani]|uniref:TIGR04086 family membrane protein n=1 Tax=Clostridium tetani TaxID=1513 RepID=A0ABY0EPQ0_CLOTA|nr:TIGR04086 family membrane protein [Clostridium tetani]CDI50376.1 membrane protein [Clostridium tetani 12124569]KHO33727.1 membrane protein [Clostridium tetani]RXI39197.1 TIGR04086 family membrane protein [Clostridium tetani]RXI56716.1 TIGR04086 family membrane protein [Clostridium tetani]RXI65907.1 TIGR04086 family membrane protein [Clostridium tetani]